MEQRDAVKKAMLSIKMEETIPTTYYPFIRVYLNQLYVVGWEQGRSDMCQHTSKMVGQYSLGGALINTFKSIREASKRTGYHKNTINYHLKNSILKDNYTPRSGCIWKYITIKEEVIPKNNLF